MSENSKKILGQFYTVTNPFNHILFYEWYNQIENIEDEIIVEPFAGLNSIVKMIGEVSVVQPAWWDCFDIDPGVVNYTPDYKVVQRDTLSKFPSGYRVGITNPPYLARNAATRAGIKFPNTKHDDMYKLALEVMLDNLEYVAAIIPESFISQGIFTERLFGIISLNFKMFDDTDHPVCLVLFVPENTEDFPIYSGGKYLGMYSILKKEKDKVISFAGEDYGWKFNDPNGQIGIRAIDNTGGNSIEFCVGDNIPGHKVKSTSRSITRVSGPIISEDRLEDFISILNSIVMDYRKNTGDVFMSAFKGLRKDGKYRRRISYTDLRSILNNGYEIFNNN